MDKKFEFIRTKIKGGFQSGTHNSKSGLPLVWFKDCIVKVSVMMNENYTVNLYLFNLFYDEKLLPSLK